MKVKITEGCVFRCEIDPFANEQESKTIYLTIELLFVEMKVFNELPK